MFGDVLRTYRKESGLTQEELAHRAEIHRTYVSLLERNEKSPTLNVLFRICKALEVRPSEVLDGVEESMDDGERWW
jgi:transcriptional regulator with XRE-family HTH domain